MMDLNKAEHQQLVLMTGSRKAWAVYLGIDEKEARALWNEIGLQTPAQWFRAQTGQVRLELLAKCGSYQKLGAYLHLSVSFLQKEMQIRVTHPPWTGADVVELFDKYKSVQLVSRIQGIAPTEVRRRIKALGMDLNQLTDYSEGGHANAKGRRAEEDFATLRASKIIEDLNVTIGPHAGYDFDDADFGRVNVKSSKRYKYRARSRADDPFYWKMSCRGKSECDYLILLAYDEGGTSLQGVAVFKSEDVDSMSTVTVQSDQLLPISWRTLMGMGDIEADIEALTSREAWTL